MSESNESNHHLVSLWSTFGSCVADIMTYPFELLTTYTKSQNQRLPFVRMVKSFVDEFGVRGLFKGFSTVFGTALIPNFIYFFSYESINQFLIKRLRQADQLSLNVFIPVISSLTSETIYILFYVPADTVQTRLQLNSEQYQYRSLSRGMLEVVRTEGFLRLFSASPLYIIQHILLTPIQFTCYEWLKMSRFNKNVDRNKISYLESVIYAIIASSVAAVVTNPINTLVILYQITEFEKGSGGLASTWRFVKQSYKTHGFAGLNRGMSVRLLETNMNAIVFMPIFELVRQNYGVDIMK